MSGVSYISLTRCGSKPRLLGMLAMTTTYMIIELVVGNHTNSMALVADSFHMLSDVIALIIAYISIKMSPKEWSKNTFGWARAEGATIPCHISQCHCPYAYCSCFDGLVLLCQFSERWP